MEQGLVKKETLTAIGNSIRAKNGTQDTYTPAEMPGAIDAIETGGGGGNEPTAEELTITGNCEYRFANGSWDWVIEKYGNQITTKDVLSSNRMFKESKVDIIPFEINYSNIDIISLDYMFQNASNIKSIPKMNHCKPKAMGSMFFECENITEFPADMDKWFDWSAIDGATGPYSGGDMSYFLSSMCRLRKFPNHILQHANPYANQYNNIYKGTGSLYVLDEIIDLPNPHYKAKWTSNTMRDIGNSYFHLGDLTFAPTMTNSEPNNPQWSNQTIDLTRTVGYAYGYPLSTYGLPAEKEIKDDATYQQFKDDPDAWTQLQEYSRYNHDSAVRTINSLPDTSAFIASNGGKNTIKFAGANGSKTDGGAISNLTPEEIAVATARGWTVEIV